MSAGSTCTVTVPNLANHDCTVSVNPSGLDELVVVEGANNQVITFPTTFETDVFVDIFCTGPAPESGAGEAPAAQPADATTPEVDPSLASSITVIYNSTNIGPEVVTLLCADLGGINTFTEGLGSGPNEASALELIQDPVSAGSTCTVTVPNLANHDCTVSVNPSGLDELVVVEGANNQVITFPTTFETDVFVDIFCTGPGPDGAVDTEVLGEVTSAPIAQATNGEPTFTG